MNREGFFIRAGAYVLDTVFCVVPAWVVMFVAAAAVGPWLASVLSLGFFVAYSTLDVFRGATFGKSILGVKITNEDGTAAEFGTLLKRWAIKYSPALFYFVAALTTVNFFNYFGHFAAIAFCISASLTFKAQRQALHDTLTHTAVYKTQTTVAAAPAAPAPAEEPQKQAA